VAVNQRGLRRLLFGLSILQALLYLLLWLLVAISSIGGPYLGSLIAAGIFGTAVTTWMIVSTLLVYVYPTKLKGKQNPVVAASAGIVGVFTMVFLLGNSIGSAPTAMTLIELLALVVLIGEVGLTIFWTALMFVKCTTDGLFSNGARGETA
jgi:hypothetical protein